MELLRGLIDPDCSWMRASSVPQGVREVMEALVEFTKDFGDKRKQNESLD